MQNRNVIVFFFHLFIFVSDGTVTIEISVPEAVEHAQWKTGESIDTKSVYSFTNNI